MHSLTRWIPAKRTKKLALTRTGNADVVSMTDHRVTNLYGKILSKLIHCFLVMLIKVLSFSINMLCFVKIQSMNLPKIFIKKSDLRNLTLCNMVNDKLDLDTVS